ncbi:MAG TPA: type II CAAX endopeptidase family protein [Natrialbaceae archaeon]|nr:type II CAAX endopeptidase family protein [Natrialbaceae archaeon]
MKDELSPERLSRDRASPILHSVLVVVAAFVVGIVIAILGGSLVLGTELASGQESTGFFLTTSILQFVGFGLVVLAYLEWRSQWDLINVSLPSLRDVAWVVLGFVGLFAAVYVIGVIITLLGQQTAENAVVTEGQQNPVLFLYMIPVTILFVAPAEEFLFRGVVQGLFRRAYGSVVAVLAASGMFGVVHWIALSGGGKVTYIAVAAVLGLALGAVYERTKNILVPIAVHGLYNALLFSIQWLVATGQVPTG